MASSAEFSDSRNSHASHFFSKMAFGKCRRVWRVLAKCLANVDKSGESSQNCLANVGTSGDSLIFPKKAILANSTTC